MGVGGQDIWAVNVLLAARDSDEEFDVSNFFVTLPTVEEKANIRTDGRTDTPKYIVDCKLPHTNSFY